MYSKRYEQTDQKTKTKQIPYNEKKSFAKKTSKTKLTTKVKINKV